MVIKKDSPEWKFVTNYCPACGSENIEHRNETMWDFHCNNCNCDFDSIIGG